MSKAGTSFNKSKYIVDNFDRALEEGWIEVYFQPIIRTSNDRVCGEEALVRWEDPVLGMLNPVDFVPALEAVNEVYRLDFYVLEKTLDKMKEQRKRGLYVVPTSVNISQVDFYACDVVDEITERVEALGISRRMIAVEISEGSITVGNDFIISQIEQLQDLGFQVWMDDYGSGNSALALFQIIHFDLLKINMYYVKQILTSESARIILTELVRMAMSLGMETVVEGVEFKEQVEFLKEIGCTKLQGFYYCKPIPISQVFERYEKGIAIGFENPNESSYYSAIGKINLYDISFAREGGEALDDYFDTFPMAIIESDGDNIRVIRGNKSFKEFFIHNFDIKATDFVYAFGEESGGIGTYTMNSIRKCGSDGQRLIIDDRMPDGRVVQMLMQRISVNPVTRVAAVAFVILSVSEKRKVSEALTYNYIARALSEDYIDLFYVNLETDEFVEYNPDGLNRNVSIDRRGKGFFSDEIISYAKKIYAEDLELLKQTFTRERIKEDIAEHGVYSITFRQMIKGVPTYVSLKAVRVRTDDKHILIGINNVDNQMKQREIIERVKEERLTYNRIMALSGDYISIYSVDPRTDSYICFNSAASYDGLALPDRGESFFEESRANASRVIYPDDLKGFLKVFQKKKVLAAIEDNGLFLYNYRLMVGGVATHVCIKATIVEETSGSQLIVGINNIEKQVTLEEEYTKSLLEAEDKAIKDQLTGVKNKRAYSDDEDYLNIQIKAGLNPEFAVVVCDLNGLKQINDSLGHQAGDDYIKEGCRIICDAFARSPVYRTGGDEFVVIAEGKDYNTLDTRIERINRANRKNQKTGEVTIAVGTAAFNGAEDKVVLDVFKRADAAMYENKRIMKEK